MGKKQADRILDLQRRFEDQGRVVREFQRERAQREAAHAKLTAEILKEMTEKPFTIVTASGKVIEGRAEQTQTYQLGWGPREYSASRVTLHPKHG